MKTLITIIAIFVYTISAQTLTPPQNMILKGVPTITSALAKDANQYTEFKTASFTQWHPIKKEMLIVTRAGEVNQVHRVTEPLGVKTQVTNFKEPVNGAVYEPNEGKYFLFARDVGGSENYQIYRMSGDGGDAVLLTDGRSRNGNINFSKKGDRITFTSNKRNGNDVDIYMMNPLDTGSAKLIIENTGGGWGVSDWSPDDSQLLLNEEISAEESYLWLYDISSGEKKLLTPKNDKVKISYGGSEFDGTGKGIYLTTNKDNEFYRLAHLDIASGELTYLASDIKWDVSSFTLSKNKRMLLFESNEEGISVLHLLNLETYEYMPLPKMPLCVIGSFAWHNNNEDIAVTLNSAKAQTDVYSININNQMLHRWTKSETGNIDPEDFSEARLIRWKSFDGLSISGFLYMPTAKFTGKHAVIIDVHGGPEGQSYPSFLGRYNYYLNELGVTLIFPNVRGSTGFGKTFLGMDNGFLRDNSYKDVAALIDWIKTQPDLDADRIMITGGSYGGNVTLAMAAFYADKIKCALSVVGASNLVSFLENTSGYRRDLRRVEYGDERDPKMREYLLKIAPINHVSDIKKPLFIVQGKNDPRVPASESEQIVAKMEEMKIPVWYMLAMDEGHGFQKKQNRDYQFFATIMFVKEMLLK